MPAGGDHDRLWAIAAYFNPVGYRRRRENYRRFRETLGIPLATVELAFGDRFELNDGDADILVRLRPGDVMWQKERLLNLALASLPPACRYVAWLDCDVLFGRNDWAEEAVALLDRYPLVQLFRRVQYLPADHPTDRIDAGAAYLARPSIASLSGPDIFSGYNGGGPVGHGPAASGMAWAIRRDLIEEHRFYDACIVGGGDNAMFAAAHRAPWHGVARQRMNDRHAAHFGAWAEAFGKSVAGDVASLDGDLYHLWHGDLANRGRLIRFEALAGHGFDPDVDIAVDGSGAWRWSSGKPAMHTYLKGYFVSRREDGEGEASPHFSPLHAQEQARPVARRWSPAWPGMHRGTGSETA